MKMNKEVRNYIASLVKNKAAAKRTELVKAFEKVDAERDTILGEFKAEVDSITAPLVEKIESLMKKHGISHTKNWNGTRESVRINVQGICGGVKALDTAVSKATKKIEELDGKIHSTIDEVIAKLSLGGDAEDLERIVAKLKF